MRHLLPACLPLLIVACAPVSAPVSDPVALGPPKPLSAQGERYLAGKVPGDPVSCLSARDSERAVTLEDGFAYRVSSKLVYVQRFGGQCDRSLLRDSYLVRRSTLSQLCRGDIADLNQQISNIPLGTCVYDDFVPYRTPE